MRVHVCMMQAATGKSFIMRQACVGAAYDASTIATFYIGTVERPQQVAKASLALLELRAGAELDSDVVTDFKCDGADCADGPTTPDIIDESVVTPGDELLELLRIESEDMCAAQRA
jgi:hypothetical protein